ncbi:hypothetical protein CP061683_0976, partial [Chlamydia psittaci 06-1683]
TIFLRH